MAGRDGGARAAALLLEALGALGELVCAGRHDKVVAVQLQVSDVTRRRGYIPR